MLRKHLLPLVALVAFALPVSAFAQDATPEVPAVEVTTVPVPDEPSVIVIETPAPVPLTPAEGIDLANVLWGLLIALVGGGSFAFVLHSLDKREKDIVERAFQSLPPQAQDTIRAGVSLAEQALDIMHRAADILEAAVTTGKEVTDGLPNTDAQAGSDQRPVG